MKKLVLFCALSISFAAANAQKPATDPHAGHNHAQPAQTVQAAPPQADQLFSFKNADYDFGKIVFGKAVEFDVEVKNNSKDSVKVDRVQVSCGCTTPKYDANAKIAPGQTSKITLGFNGMNDGRFEKTATIFFSNGATKLVKFHGETYKAPAEAAPANQNLQKLKTGTK